MQRIMEVFGLSQREAGALFNVSAKTIARWSKRGVPNGRLSDVRRVHELVELYAHKFLADRIPRIVRTRAVSLGNKTILDVVREHGTTPVVTHLAQLLTYMPQ
jgi:transposase